MLSFVEELHCSFLPGVNPYAESKTLAERAAWDFIRTSGGGLELAVVNPVSRPSMSDRV